MREEWKCRFDSGNDEESTPKNGRQRLNDFLAFLVFGGRPGFEPALNKTGIMLQKIERNDSRQHREEKPVSPRLPEMESPGGGEKHDSHDDLKPDEAGNSLLCEFLHDLRSVANSGRSDYLQIGRTSMPSFRPHFEQPAGTQWQQYHR